MFTGRPIFAEDGKIRHIRSVVLITLALSCLQLPALGQQTYQWTGADNNQLWSDPVNWNPNGVPGQTCTNCSVDVPFPSGPYPIQNVSPLTIDSLTVASGERADMVDGDSITLTGSTLSGPLFMNNAGGATTTLNISIGSSVSYTNASNSQGLTMANNSSILGSGSLINQGMISYGGQSGHIGDGSLTFVNSAGATLISGGMGGSTSILSICPNVDWTNAGIIEAENGATLNINCGTITQSGSGQFSADNAKIVLADATIVGGLLASPSGGSFNVGFGSSATLENLTISDSALTARTRKRYCPEASRG